MKEEGRKKSERQGKEGHLYDDTKWVFNKCLMDKCSKVMKKEPMILI